MKRLDLPFSAFTLPCEPGEEWRKSTLGEVYVSNLGRAFNAAPRSMCFLQGSVLNAKSGTVALVVQVDGKSQTAPLSRLVAEVFLPLPAELADLPPNRREAKHLDGDKSNNAVSNLVWIGRNQGLPRASEWSPPVDSATMTSPAGEVYHETWGQFRNSQYFVSTFGRVYSAKTMTLLTPYREPMGYLRMTLRSIGIFFVHRLVAEVFCSGRTLEKNIVDHVDGVKTNNYAWNLEWVTYEENTRRAVARGLVKTGADHHNALLTTEQVTEARYLYLSDTWSLVELATKYGVARQTLTRAIQGTTGYKSDAPTSATSTAAAQQAKVAAVQAYWAASEPERTSRKEERASRARPTNSRLTVAEVQTIKRALQTRPRQVVADEAGLLLASINAIADGHSYAWVTETSTEADRPKPGPKNLAQRADDGEAHGRTVVTVSVITDALRLRDDGMSCLAASEALGLHSGTVKVIYGGRHRLQKDGLAPMPTVRSQSAKVHAIIGKVTPDLIEEALTLYESGVNVYHICQQLGLSYVALEPVLAGRHFLQKEGQARVPTTPYVRQSRSRSQS